VESSHEVKMTDHTQEIIPILHIERKPNSAKYRVIGKGITVEFLSLFLNDPEWTVERICEDYDLTPAEVHAAWAFYYDHKAAIDQHAAEEAAISPEESQEAAETYQRLSLGRPGDKAH